MQAGFMCNIFYIFALMSRIDINKKENRIRHVHRVEPNMFGALP